MSYPHKIRDFDRNWPANPEWVIPNPVVAVPHEPAPGERGPGPLPGGQIPGQGDYQDLLLQHIRGWDKQLFAGSN